MTVSSSINRNDYAGNGSTTNFAVSFRFLQNSDVKATIRDASGGETLQVETTNYTLTGAGDAGGGTLVMLVAPATGTTLTIQRDVPATQETDYVENDEFPAESHENALDKLTMLAQQEEEVSSRHIGFSDTVSDATGSAVELSQDKVQRADKFMGFDSAGNLVTKTPLQAGLLDQDQQDKRLGPIFATVAAMVAANPVALDEIVVNLVAGMVVVIDDYATGNNSGVLFGRIVAGGTGTADGGSFIDLANGLQWRQNFPAIISIKLFGNVGDGVATTESASLQNAATFAAPDGRTLYGPAGVYLITVAINWPVGVSFKGEAVPTADPTNLVLGTRLKRTTDNSIFNIIGTDRTTDRVGHNVFQQIAFEDASGASTARWIVAKYVDSLVWRDCMFFQATSVTTTGTCIDAEECWDWRFYNCIWKQVGSASASIIRAFNGADDSCNAWNFLDCRWQESRGFAVNFDCTGAGNDNVEFFFTACKWEDTAGNAPRHITVTEGASGKGASRIHFTTCFLWTADGYLCATGLNGNGWTWSGGCQFANGGKGETPQAYLQIQIPNCSLTGNFFQVPGAAHVGIASYIDADFTSTQNINIIGNSESGGGAGTRGFDTHKLIDVQPRFSTISGNSDFRMKTTGTGIIANGTTSIVVTHNIAVGTPLSPQVRITPLGNLGAAKTWWVSAVGATTFTINVDVDPGINVTFAFEVDATTRTE